MAWKIQALVNLPVQALPVSRPEYRHYMRAGEIKTFLDEFDPSTYIDSRVDDAGNPVSEPKIKVLEGPKKKSSRKRS